MIYSLYIFDRHCECVYYQDWHRTAPVRPPISFKPGVHRLPAPAPPPAQRESVFAASSSGLIPPSTTAPAPAVAVAAPTGTNTSTNTKANASSSSAGLPFDEEAKLVYGVVLSLRNMVKKLAGREEAFTSYRTPTYKFHLFETPSNIRFVLLSDPSSDSLRFVLRQIYTGPFVEHVVRNPLVDMAARETGIDNEQFRAAVDRHIRALSMYA